MKGIFTEKWTFIILALFVGHLNVSGQEAEMELLFNWRNNALPPSAAYANTYNEVWGIEQSSREYGIIGSTWGTHFFDITDPSNVVQVDSVAGAVQGSVIVHRDYHDYNGYLYAACDEGESTLQIMDLRYLPDSVHVVYDSPDAFKNAHNIFIDEDEARLYTFSTRFHPAGSSAIGVFSLEDPIDPQLLGIENGFIAHDGFVRNNLMFVNAAYDGLIVFDFTSATDPIPLGSLDVYPEPGYNHSGWLNEEGNIYVFADETSGTALKVCDVTDLTDINVISTFKSEVDPNSIPHNLVILDDRVFVSYYHDGLYIYNIADPSDPQLEFSYDTYIPSDHDSYRGAWGVYPLLPSGLILVSDMQHGFFVFRINESTAISDIEGLEQLNVYPTVSNGVFNLQLDAEHTTRAEIFVADMSGKTIWSEQSTCQVGRNQFRIELSANIASGLYNLVVNIDGQTTSRKIFKAN